MTGATFDTYKHIKKLKELGATEALAEAITNMVKESQDVNLSFLATKLDVQEVKTEIQSLRSEMKTSIADMKTLVAETKSELRAWMFTVLIAIVGLLTGILLKMH